MASIRAPGPGKSLLSPITNCAEWMNGKPVGLPSATRPTVDSVFLSQPETDWTYSHHPSITFFQDRFFAMWSNGRKDEDAPGQRVLLTTATDFGSWGEPYPLADSEQDSNGGERVLTAAGFHQYNETLIAYFGNYGPNIAGDARGSASTFGERRSRTPTQTPINGETFLQAKLTTDGSHWSAQHDIGIPITPNHPPQGIASGRLIISGNTTFPWTEDPSGLLGYQMAGIYPASLSAEIQDNPATFWDVAEQQRWPIALCEGSFYQSDDGVLHMLLRSTSSKFRHRLWVTESLDDGSTWTAPLETAFSDTDTKFHFGRLPDGRFYYVGSPIGSGRTPLVLSLSIDGVRFDKHFILGDDCYTLRRAGAHKSGEYGYPHTLIHDQSFYVIVSRQKEAIQVLRLALSELDA